MKITGIVSKANNTFWIGNLLLKRTGNNDIEDKLLNRLVGYKIEANGLIYNNIFFMHSYELKGNK